MIFDIEKLLQFDTENATLVNQMTGDSIELSLTSARLLAELLNHRKDVLSREEIFQSVFDQHGARSSNSNLNQYISILRKNFFELGMEKDVIVTIPRVGFRISESVAVNAFNEKRADNFFTEDIKAVKKQSDFHAVHYLPIIILLLMSFPFMLFKPESIPDDTTTKKVQQGKCIIFSPSSFSDKDVNDIISVTTQNTGKLDCSIEKEIYIDRLQINSALGTNNQMLFIECISSNNKCISYYFREKENA